MYLSPLVWSLCSAAEPHGLARQILGGWGGMSFCTLMRANRLHSVTHICICIKFPICHGHNTLHRRTLCLATTLYCSGVPGSMQNEHTVPHFAGTCARPYRGVTINMYTMCTLSHVSVCSLFVSCLHALLRWPVDGRSPDGFCRQCAVCCTMLLLESAITCWDYL